MSFERSLTPKAQQALQNAKALAVSLEESTVSTLHLLAGILELKSSLAHNALAALNVDIITMRRNVKSILKATAEKGESKYTSNLKRSLLFARKEQEAFDSGMIGTEHLLLGLILNSECRASIYLRSIGFEAMELRAVVKDILTPSSMPLHIEPFNGPPKPKTTEEKYPNLCKSSDNITGKVEKGLIDPVIGRSAEMDRLVNVLCRRRKNNPVLLGEAGVGKTAIVEGLAARIVAGDVPDKLKGKIIFSIDMTNVVAGTQYRGQFEEKVRKLVEEAVASDEIILFIDELHTIVGAGSAEGSLDTANILKPYLARGDLTCIGATTVNEYKASIERDAALGRRFQPIDILESTEEETLEILNGIKDSYEKYHELTYSPEALQACVSLAAERIRDRQFPDKAIDLLDEVGSTVNIHGRDTVTAEDVEAVVDSIENAAKIKAPKSVGFGG